MFQHFISPFSMLPARLSPAAIVCVAASLLPGESAFAQAPAAPPEMLQMQQAEALGAAGKHAEAAAAYESVAKNFPNGPVAPEANFRAGYSHYLAEKYDAALASFKKVTDAKNLLPEQAVLLELALSMTPQVLATKASKMEIADPKRKSTLEEAVKQFDAYLAKYPSTDESESAYYGKGLALYQLEKYDAAMEVLRANMAKFPQSPTIQDSQFLLALTLATVASQAMQKGAAADAGPAQQYDESEKLLRGIITANQNLALINDAQFQLGELFLARGGFLQGDENKEKRTEFFERALDAYRAVAGKDRVVAAQQARVAFFRDLMVKAGSAKDIPGFQKYKRIVDKETEKLAQVQERGDQTQVAKFKTGLIFFAQGKMDETRVLYTHLENLGAIEEAADKKQALYFVTISYAAQNVADKAVEKYNAFQAAHKGDPIAQNLQLVMGAMYLTEKLNDPNKAIQYFNEGLQIYPKGSVFGALILARASAQIQLKNFAEAEKALQDTLKKKPPKELAVDAEFYLGTVQVQTGKTKEAVNTFKAVRDNYPGTPQAEQAFSQVGQLLSRLDPKAAITELQAFLSKFPQSGEVPAVLMALGTAQSATKQADAALATYKKVATDFPKSDPAPFSYFERAKILNAAQKYDECVAVMKEFIAQYPDSPTLFQAYDFTAQILISQSKGPDAIGVYEEFVAKRPKDPSAAEALLKISTLWKGYMDAQGNYIVIEEAKRTEWKKGAEKSIAAAEKLLAEFPDSQQVAQALNNLMEVQQLQQSAKLTTEADLEQYFRDLAEKFAGKPNTQAKVLFTLASFTFGKDKAKALEQMAAAYKPDLKFAPDDLDLYGQALIENKKIDEAIRIYEKLNKDYPLPGGEPKAAPREVQEAQAIVLAGLGKALQEKGDAASREKGAKMFAELEANYPRSPKMTEVNYGTAIALHDQKKDDEALKRLAEINKAPKASTELRAKSMLLIAKIHEANGRYELAIDNFLKISVYFQGVPKIAAEGLFRGAQLLERQASGEIPMPTPTPKPAASPAPAKK